MTKKEGKERKSVSNLQAKAREMKYQARLGTMERKTGAAPNTRPFLLITGAPLTESACASKEPTPCVQNVNATIPDSKKLARNGFGSVMGRARQI